MAIRRVEMQDFLVFSGKFAAEFCRGVNVIIGGNGTGKTTLMKALHWACEFAEKCDFIDSDGRVRLDNKPTEAYISPFRLKDYFAGGFIPLSNTTEKRRKEYSAKLRVIEYETDGGVPLLKASATKNLDYLYIGDEQDAMDIALWCNRACPSVYIPTTEMLSHSRGFLALNKERLIPFDKTEVDILAKAELGVSREITPIVDKLLDQISEVIGGTVEHDGKDFYVVKKENDEWIPFSFEASGYRKLGLLWKLLRNGMLEPGTILFWDEPENSLNPELMPVLVDVLLELSRNDVQIFLATHSEMLARYFAVNRSTEDEVRFISLYKDGSQIKADADRRFDLLEPNSLMTVPVKLYEDEIKKGLGGND